VKPSFGVAPCRGSSSILTLQLYLLYRAVTVVYIGGRHKERGRRKCFPCVGGPPH